MHVSCCALVRSVAAHNDGSIGHFVKLGIVDNVVAGVVVIIDARTAKHDARTAGDHRNGSSLSNPCGMGLPCRSFYRHLDCFTFFARETRCIITDPRCVSPTTCTRACELRQLCRSFITICPSVDRVCTSAAQKQQRSHSKTISLSL